MELERGVVNAREVARARWLVVLGSYRERVRVDTRGRYVREVLVRLNPVEVVAAALLEAVMAVELDESRHNGVVAGKALDESVRVARLEDGAVPRIGVVERLLAMVVVYSVVVAADEVIALNNPREELDGVVEVHAELVGRGSDRLLASELELLDEVLVRVLGKLAALIRVEVDVVNEERASLETLLAHVRSDGGLVGPAHVLYRGKVNLDLDLVVLEGNQRESKTGVAAVEELKRNVKRVRGSTPADSRRLNGGVVAIRGAGIITGLATALKQVDKLRDVANHASVSALLARRKRELVPDVHPVAVLLINLLATNLQLDLLDKVVAGPVEPAEVAIAEVGAVLAKNIHQVNLGERGLNVRLPDEITVARDLARDVLAAEGGRAVERLLDRLDRKVRVAPVDNLEEGNLRVARKIHVLSAISYKLHKTATHFI